MKVSRQRNLPAYVIIAQKNHLCNLKLENL